ncbi:SH3 domain-containing protein 2-like isoform X2 [Phoenix dactylifera]|uniref:SH3 domain-containing protein 2-like isoform X2 n=1 Tax=Phoenix dactylifera TaxID=42345 RepID=A0A8B7CTM3_PHODC|nr:SH3 domain-containing protein 2-like isoform X2 [Phoenix dactylifera]
MWGRLNVTLAVLLQFSRRFGHDSGLVDEAELQCHQKLQMLYGSTRAAKHLQRDIVRGVEAFITISVKQMEIVKKLAEDCCKYGNDYQSPSFVLPTASLDFGTSHSLMEKERENLIKILGDQVCEPLRAMITGARLEDARLLTYHYERIRQDVEAQTAEVVRRQLKSKEVSASAESARKLQHAEAKLSELNAILSALGREATAAMMAVEAQQQRITFQRLLAMVDAERAYHQSVASILDNLHDEMVQAKQHNESMLQPTTIMTKEPSQTVNEDLKTSQSADLLQSTEIEINMHSQTTNEDPKSSRSADIPANSLTTTHFVAEVIHPFDAQADGELNLSVGDYVVVLQVAPNGWSEGECKGKAGWFPSAYIEQRDKFPESKVIEPSMLS